MSNLCRICLQEYKDDFESIFGNDADKKVISLLGLLYVELLHLSVDSNDNSPQFLCNYCNLQLKLFHKFKTKAIESFTKFSEHNLDKNNGFPLGEISEDEENNDVDVNAYEENNDEDTEVDEEDQEFKFEMMTSSEDEERPEETVEMCQENVELGPVKLENDGTEIEDEGLLEFEEVMYLEDDQDETLAENVSEIEQKSNAADKTTKAGKFPCKSCEEVFDFKSHLTKHRNKHMLSCTLCPKKFLTESSLKVHTNVKHKGLPAYECQECPKVYQHKNALEYHMKGHRNERDVPCPLCSKMFLSKTDLGIHLRVHYDIRPYLCDVCGKAFRAHTHMTEHRSGHFEKKLKCDICQQRFCRASILKLHIITVHNNEYNYECNVCPKKYKRAQHLKRHQLKNHSTIKTEKKKT